MNVSPLAADGSTSCLGLSADFSLGGNVSPAALSLQRRCALNLILRNYYHVPKVRSIYFYMYKYTGAGLDSRILVLRMY